MAEIGETVLVHYVGTLDDGREFVNSRNAGEPVRVRIGSGSLLPALEGALCEMLPGDHRVILLASERAYGVYDDALVQPVGQYIEMRTRAGAIRAKVVSSDGDEVILDCNHELAGRSVTFDVEMLSVAHESAIHRELHPAGCACGCDKLKQQIG